ncbi:MAG TPA: chemotaxis protein CheW [Burkholderiaceae bacterium]
MSSTYKGLEFPDHVAPFLHHMEAMNDHREALRALQSSWDTLALLGHLSNLRADMSETRESFDSLTGRLLASLAQESLSRVLGGLGYKAQVAIDILVRNLFERTADIGFLATDASIIEACHVQAQAAAATNTHDTTRALRERFAAYVQRYSVYQDVVLLTPSGERICQLRDAPPASSAALAAPACAASGYVERFDATPFTGTAPVLTYSSAVRAAGGSPMGALVLVFDLAGESAVVFDKLCEREELIAFLDGAGKVVASSDSQLLPIGYRMPRAGTSSLVRVGGCSYVAVQRGAASYQGYAGPGWTAIALTPADAAFVRSTRSEDVRFSGEGIFSPELIAIPEEASHIQRRLERIVWNGRLQQGDDETNRFSRALLQEIAATGRRTRAIFETSTRELLGTAAASLLEESRMLSALAVDILDRNLFERACDCRWWAQDATLQSLEPGASRDVLKYINGLYTVYTDIVLFDGQGRVVTSSRGHVAPGTLLDDAWARDCLGVAQPLGYAVSAFAPASLYDGAATYIYTAPLRDQGRVVGGVGLVFDAAPQFRAMLEAALPKREGAAAAFLRQDGTPISAIGTLPIEPSPHMLALAPGQSWSGFVTQAGRCYAVSATAGSGYREFKTSDGYRETVVSLVVVPCGAARDAADRDRGALTPVAGGQEVATFDIGTQSVGVLSGHIIECIEVDRSVRVPAKLGTGVLGYTPWRDGMLPLVDIGEQLGEMLPDGQQAVVMQVDDRPFGLLVSELGPIVELEVSDMPMRSRVPGGRDLMSLIAKSRSGMVPLLSPDSVAELARDSRAIGGA